MIGHKLPRAGWWSLLLVGCVHLLTTPAVLVSTDHVEMMFTAERLIAHGTLELGDKPDTRVPELSWLPWRPGFPVRTRHLPMTAAILAPLLWLEHVFHLGQPGQLGPFTRLHGHLFVLAALYLLGRAAQRAGASPGGIAIAVALTGLAWPVWKASCAPGPEAILVFWLALYVWADPRDEHGSRSTWLRAAVLAVLPWAHASGTMLTGGLLVGEGFAATGPRGRTAIGRLAAGAAIGIASMFYFWNWRYHGDWWAGGYRLYDPGAFMKWDLRPGLWAYGTHAIRDAPGIPLLLVAAIFTRAPFPRSASRRAIILTVLLILGLALIRPPEPERRLAPLWPMWGALAALTWDRLAWRRPLPQALLALQGLTAFAGFWQASGRHLLGPGTLYYPNILWAQWAIDGHTAAAAIVAALLIGGIVVAASHVGRELAYSFRED